MSKRYNLPNGALSFSSMSMFTACQQRFANRYVHRLQTEFIGTDSMDRGWAFHKMVENIENPEPVVASVFSRLKNSYEFERVNSAFNEFRSKVKDGLVPLLKGSELKLYSEQHQFVGFVDRYDIDEETGQWQLGEMKTSSRFDFNSWLLAPFSFQTALYLKLAMDEWAPSQTLSREDFAGYAYEKVIFSGKKPLKATKTKPEETPAQFRERIKGDTKVYHQRIEANVEIQAQAMQAFESAKEGVDLIMRNPSHATKNPSNCFQWGRPCEYMRQCWGLDMEDAISKHPEGTVDFSEEIQE